MGPHLQREEESSCKPLSVASEAMDSLSASNFLHLLPSAAAAAAALLTFAHTWMVTLLWYICLAFLLSLNLSANA